MKFYLALAGLLLAVMQISAQQDQCNLNITGRILDSNSEKGLPYATVQVNESAKGAVSDTMGVFHLTDLCSGFITLNIAHIGCAPESRTFFLHSDTTVTFYMDHSDHILKEFEVVAEAERLSAGRNVQLSKLEMRETTGLQLADRMVEMPGIRVLQSGNTISKPIYRGLHSSRLLIFNNGVRQEGQYWGAEHAPEIDSYLIERIELLDGVEGLAYAPDAIGGIIKVESESAFVADSLHGDFQSSLSSNGWGGSAALLIGGRLAEKIPLYYQFQGSLKKLGDVETPDVVLSNTGIEEYNYSYALGYKTKRLVLSTFYSKFNQEVGIYRFSHLGNLTDLLEVLSGGRQPDTLAFSYDINRPRQVIGHELFKAELRWQTGSWSSLSAKYSRQFNSRQEFDAHAGINPSEQELARPQLSYRLLTHQADVAFSYRKEKLEGKMGVAAISRTNTFSGRSFIPNYENYEVGLYLVQSYTLPGIKLNGGLRYDFYNSDIFAPYGSPDNPVNQTFKGVAAALSAVQQFENASIKYEISSHWRAPGVNELFSSGLHHGVGIIEQGDSTLSQERSYNATLVFVKHWQKHEFRVSPYVNYIRNFIYLNPESIELTIRGAFPRMDYKQANAIFAGVDLGYSTHFKRVDMTIAASLIYAENVSQNSRLNGVPPHQFSAEARYNFRSRRKIENPFFAVKGSYTMEQYHSPQVLPSDLFLNQNIDATLPSSFDFAAAPEGYFLLNIQAGFSIKRNIISLSVDNALNKTYRNYLDLFRYYADQPGVNFTLRYQYIF